MRKILFFLILMVHFACGDQSTPQEQSSDERTTTAADEKTTNPSPDPVNEEEKLAFMNGEVDYEVIAQDFCECSQEAIKIHQETESLMDPANKQQYDEYSNQRSASQEEAVKCCIDKKAERTKTKLDKPKLAEYLKTECEAMHASLMIQILLKAIY